MEAPFLDISIHSIWQRIQFFFFFEQSASVFPSPEVKISAFSGMREENERKV